MTLSQVVEDLTEDKFCKGHLAVDATGASVAYSSPDACRWCIQGWLRKMNAPLPVWDRVNEIARSNDFVSAISANDTLGYEFVKLLRQEGDK